MLPSTLDMEPSTLDPRQKDRLPVNHRATHCNTMSAILNTFNEEAVCKGKMRVTHYNIERQKPRENNLDLFFLA